MPFIDKSTSAGVLESAAGGGLEAVRKATHVGEGEKRKHLIAVAILADMAKEGRTLAVVTRPYAYRHSVHDTVVEVEVPQGFVTDFASIPTFVQWIVQPFGRHAPAAVLHDYLYAIGQKKSRALADRLFLNAMKEAGVPAYRASLMFRMVRLLGWRGYGREADWAFVDTETGETAGEPFTRVGLRWAPDKPKRGKAKAVVKASAAPPAEKSSAGGAA